MLGLKLRYKSKEPFHFVSFLNYPRCREDQFLLPQFNLGRLLMNPVKWLTCLAGKGETFAVLSSQEFISVT